VDIASIRSAHVTSPNRVTGRISPSSRRHRRIDVLVNNTSIGDDGPIEQQSLDDLRQGIQVKPPHRCTIVNNHCRSTVYGHQAIRTRAVIGQTRAFSCSGHTSLQVRGRAGRFCPSSGQPVAPGGEAMTFVQIIEMTTTKASEVEELMNGWMAATEGRRSASRSLLTKDRERPDTYVQVVEFPSYEEAMANSALPETTALAENLSDLCVSGPTFRNLDLVRVDEL
jgi:hypothetical protein